MDLQRQSEIFYETRSNSIGQIISMAAQQSDNIKTVAGNKKKKKKKKKSGPKKKELPKVPKKAKNRYPICTCLLLSDKV